MQIGYDENFIGDGIKIPMPKIKDPTNRSVLRIPNVLRKGKYSEHLHFSLVMNKHTRQLIYSAYNIDQKQFPSANKTRGKGTRGWRNDNNIAPENQLNNKYYKDRKDDTGATIKNPYDRGHMVMRFNNMWGIPNDEFDKAGKATFIYSNSSLQHENLNRDEWKAIELDVVHEFNEDANGRLAVFTGPIFGDLDRHINLTDIDTARVPSGFFKVICYKKKDSVPGDELGVLAFAVFQDDAVLRDKKGGKTIKENMTYQVTISEIQNWTDIEFDKIIWQQNPLFFKNIKQRNHDHHVSFSPERIPMTGIENIITNGDDKRKHIQHLAERRIIINSAMVNPKGNEKRGEWISLHNRGDRKININKWRLVDGQGREGVLKGSIESGESIRLKGNSKGKVLLSNSGGSLMLFDNDGCVIDHVTWSKSQIRRVPEGVAFLFANGN